MAHARYVARDFRLSFCPRWFEGGKKGGQKGAKKRRKRGGQKAAYFTALSAAMRDEEGGDAGAVSRFQDRFGDAPVTVRKGPAQMPKGWVQH